MKSIFGKRNETKGTIWSLSKMVMLIGALLLFTILWGFYERFSEIQSVSKANTEVVNLARVLEEISSSPSECEIIYYLPGDVFGHRYNVSLSQNKIEMDLESGNGVKTSFFVLESVKNFSVSQGSILRIKKFNSSIEVEKK